MTRETVHIISHSHWDREWYLSFEEHRMRLVELIDDLFELFENDPNFKSFHLDGQTIILDDYLTIKPQNREKLARYIREGKLKIGPFYILQDDYLISSEANVRNTLIGHLESKKWGTPPKIGYFPDTFGNAGQIPQLLKQANIDVALFGRGVKPVGFDNQVLSDEQFQSQYSEMNWIGADGTQVLGILFANWYSNGNEIPVDRDQAKVFWDKKLEDVRKYASTPHLLMMNGCDHQPVQKDLSEAIEIAKELYPDINFVHSNFEDYIKAVQENLPNELSHVKGELTSQETDGWYTLANTASSRIYLKQSNDKASKFLEQVVEPLIVLTGEEYPREELQYAWKLLLENSPHDSICGCSVDDVHKEMEVRFNKVNQVSHYLANRTFEKWSKKVNSIDLDGYVFTVFNTSSSRKTGLVELELIVDETDFRDGRLEYHHRKMESINLPTLGLFNSQGERIWAEIEDLGVQFDYHLPKDAFRSAVFARKIRVSFVADEIEPFSWQTYQVKSASEETYSITPELFENDFVKISRTTSGLKLTDKVLGHEIDNFIHFEDVGDIGNEYAHFAPVGVDPIYAELSDFYITKSTPDYQTARVVHQIHIPIAADEQLLLEQKSLTEYRYRQAKRSQETKSLLITTDITLYKNSPQLYFKTSFDNQMKDHRLRVIFETGLHSNEHIADSIYEVVKRQNTPNEIWENPHNPQRHRSFISLQEMTTVATVASVGLHEYEILNGSQIALTLLRSVGELGDWGDFPTPDAQCLGVSELEYGFEIHSKESFYHAVHRARVLQVPFLAGQIGKQPGTIPLDGKLSNEVIRKPEFFVTSLKPAEQNSVPLMRYFNLSDESIQLTHQANGVNLLEEEIGELPKVIGPKEIRTEIFDS